MDPKTAAQVDKSMNTMTKAQNRALEDVGNKIKDSAVHCARNPGECAANAADFVPILGSAVRCTQWGVNAAQGHAGGDGPMNCLTNLASDVIPLGVGKAFKLGATGVKAGLNIAKTGAKTSKAGLNLAKTGTKTTKAATASAREGAAKAEREAAELLRRQEQAALRNDLRKTAQSAVKGATTDVVTIAAISTRSRNRCTMTTTSRPLRRRSSTRRILCNRRRLVPWPWRWAWSPLPPSCTSHTRNSRRHSIVGT